MNVMYREDKGTGTARVRDEAESMGEMVAEIISSISPKTTQDDWLKDASLSENDWFIAV